MDIYQHFVVCMFAVAMQYIFEVNCATPDSSSSQRLDGRYLVEMGEKFNNPLLKLLGKVVRNGESNMTEKLCALHPCLEWAEWTHCPANREFSMVTRSRVCNKPTDLCAFDGQSEFTQTESKVCQGNNLQPGCPAGYNITSGVCLKYSKFTKSQWEAEEDCQLDGGHIVNINTRSKAAAVLALLSSQNGASAVIWINGNRTSSSSPWVFSYGSSPDFTNWQASEPTNGSTDLCKVEGLSPRTWHDVPCKTKYQSVCEKY